MDLHVNTPLIESLPLSKMADRAVFLKMDALQPSGSFKLRGIGHAIKLAIERDNCSHVISSSGGNAGLAAAYAARMLNVKATVVLPESTPKEVGLKLEQLGATVLVHGSMWAEAHQKAMSMVSDSGGFLVHPFDLPDIWEGHASLVLETKDELEARGKAKPSAIFVSVGGGGLILGVLRGLAKLGWEDVAVVACETEGADAFHQSVCKNERVKLPGITSIAKSLGADQVASELWKLYQEGRFRIFSLAFQDADIVRTSIQFLNDHRVLVEPACAAALQGLYAIEKSADGRLQIPASGQSPIDLSDICRGDGPVVVEVCGGSLVTLDAIENWKAQFNL